jgi:hypothetical protein
VTTPPSDQTARSSRCDCIVWPRVSYRSPGSVAQTDIAEASAGVTEFNKALVLQRLNEGFLAGRRAHEIALRCWCCNGAGVAGSERGRYETQFRRWNNDADARSHSQKLRLRVSLMGLSGVMERFGQFGCAKHVRDALEVICHRCESDFDPCTGQPAYQQTRMSEDTLARS